MRDDIKRLYKLVEHCHKSVFLELESVFKSIVAEQSIEEFVDMVYAFKQANGLLKDMQKDFNKRIFNLEKIVCLLSVKLNIDDNPKYNGMIKTDYVSAKPMTKMSVSLPSAKKDREKYNILMEKMGIPEACWKGLDRPMVLLDWLGTMEFVSKKLENAENIPKEYEDFKQTPQVTIRLYAGKEI